MLDALKPDICSVATGGYEYSSDHFEPTIQALEAGAHVLCEKPISNDLGNARKMVDTAKRLKRCFGIDLNHRFTPGGQDGETVAEGWQDWRSTLRQYGIVGRQIYAAGFGILSLKGAQSP